MLHLYLKLKPNDPMLSDKTSFFRLQTLTLYINNIWEAKHLLSESALAQKGMDQDRYKPENTREYATLVERFIAYRTNFPIFKKGPHTSPKSD